MPIDNHAERIANFRNNPVRQTALLTLLQDPNLSEALAICEFEKEMPPIALDAPEIVSVRASALSRGAARVLDTLYLLSTPIPPRPPEEAHEGSYGANLSNLPPEHQPEP